MEQMPNQQVRDNMEALKDTKRIYSNRLADNPILTRMKRQPRFPNTNISSLPVSMPRLLA